MTLTLLRHKIEQKRRKIIKLKRLKDTLTKPVRPGGFNVERTYLNDTIKRLNSEIKMFEAIEECAVEPMRAS